MPLQNPNVIDFLAFDAETDHVVLGITETRSWDGSDARVQELEEKVNAYLYFALDGPMTSQLPQLEGKSVRVQLDCVEEPDARMQNVIKAVQQMLSQHKAEFSYRVVPDLAAILAAQAEAVAHGQGGCCGKHKHTEGEPVPDDCCGGHGHGEGHGHSHGEGGCGHHGEGHGGCGHHH